MPSAHKLLLPFPDDGHPVLLASVEAALASGMGPVAVVLPTGEPGRALAGALPDLEIEKLPNPDARQGLSTSVRVALEWARRRGLPLVLLLADEPGVRADAIQALVKAAGRSDAPVLRVRYRDRTGHPVLLRRRAVEAAAADAPSGDRGLGGWMTDDRTELVDVDADAPVDVDTPRDYRAALARLPQ